MTRYLDPDFFQSTLSRGKAIACFLGAGDAFGDEPTIRWLSIRLEDDEFVVHRHEAVDPGDPEFLDVGEFQSTSADPDEPEREERHVSLEAALECAGRFGADPRRFVNESVIDDEYGEYLKRRHE